MSERYARLATGLLRRQRRAGADSLGDRAAGVAVIERALRARARRRLWRAGAVTTSVAAVLLLVWMTRWPGPALVSSPPPLPAPAAVSASGQAAGPGATLWRSGRAFALQASTPLRAGDRLESRSATDMVMDLSTGSRLRLGGGGAVELESIGPVQRFGLRSGRLRAEVAKLGAGQRFLVETSDVEVEVKGTSFEVSVEPRPLCGSTVRTRVRVHEGVVTIRHDGTMALVPAGSVWPPGCSGDPPQVAPSRLVAPARHRRAMLAPAEATPAPARQEPPASTLAEQNELFAAALAARQRGDSAAALRLLDELLDRHPGGALSGSAHDERRKIAATVPR
jgi:hypothetical protein